MSDREKTKAELIAELMQMRQQIIASEEKYRILVDNTQTPITYLTTDGYILLINKIGAENLGGVPEEFVGKSVYEILSPLAEITADRIANIDETGMGDQFEDLIALPDDERWFLSNFQPVKDADGKVFAIQIVSHDNTEQRQAEEELERYRKQLEEMVWERTEELRKQIKNRKRAQKALEESEERTRLMLESSPDFIMELNRDLRILYLNRSVLDHPVDESDGLGKSILEYILPEFHESFKESIEKTFNAGETKPIESLVNLPNGQVRLFETRFGPITRNNEIVSVVIIAIDITERKQDEEALKKREERFRAVADTATDGIVTINRDGFITYCNHGAETIFGYNADELVNKSILELIPDQSRSGYESGIQKMVAAPGPFTSEEATMGFVFKKDGSMVPVELTFARWFIGKEPFFTAIIRDITERVRAEKAIRASEERFRSIFENVTDTIVYVDMKGTLLEANRKIKDIFGYAPEELIGKGFTYLDLVSPESVEEIKRTLAETVNGGAPQSIQIEIYHRDGSTIVAETSPSLMKMSDGTEGILVIIRDITAKKRAEEALQKSENMYRLLADNVSDVIWTMDMHLQYTYFSPSVTEMLGYSVEEAMAKTLEETLTPDSFEQVTEILAEELAFESQGGKDMARSRTVEVEVYRKDRSITWVEIMGQLLRDSDGQPVGIIGVTRDISERKRAEQALKESEARFRILIENASDIIYTHDLEGNFTSANPITTRIYGYTAEEILHLNIARIVDPDHLLLAQQMIRTKLEGTTEPGPYELLTHHKNGTPIWVEVSTRLLMRNDQPIGVQGIARDITERKQAEHALRESEEKYKTLVENINDAVFSVDVEGYFTYASPAIERIWGYNVEEVLGRYFADFVVSDDLPGLAASFERTLNGQLETYEFRMRDRDGMIHYVSTSSRLLIDQDQLIGLTGVVTDITARKQAEAELLQLNKDLVALNTIAQTVTQSLDLDEMLNNTIDKILELLDVKRCFISLIEANNHMILRAHRGIPAKHLGIIRKWNLDDGTLGQAVKSGEPRFVESLTDIANLLREDVAQAINESVSGSAMYVPLRIKGKPLGVLTVITEEERIFTAEEQELLITIGHQISTVVENALLYEELRHEGEIHREGLRQAIMAQEEERRRIARELHDQTSQVLTGASAMIEASVAGLPWGFDGVKGNLKQARASLTSMLVDVRNIIYELRPTMLDDLGLVAAARWQAEEFLGRAGVEAHFEIRGRSKKLPAQMETAIFRIIQEATTNIVKHAQAKSARIKIEFGPKFITIEIEDDGNGFDLQKTLSSKKVRRGLGFVSMKERAEILGGTFVVDSQLGGGTRITVGVPI